MIFVNEDLHKKPWWFVALQLVGALLGAGIGAATPLAFAHWTFEPIIFGTLGGMMLVIGALGYLPGNYRDIHTDERMTLWKQLTPLARALSAASFVGLVGVGVAVAWYQSGEMEEKQRKQAPAAKPAPPPPTKKK